jgi:DNA polymerase
MRETRLEFEKLKVEVENCRRCPLHKNRRNPVLGDGPLESQVMLIGEAPGYWEDVQGKPFVGAAGKLLNELLASAGLSRSQVYITNVVKCRPPGNRDPKPAEIEACSPYLERQLNIIRPKIICTLGNHAAAKILPMFGFKIKPISQIHGKIFRSSSLFGEMAIIPMFHPASALYRPPVKEILFKDWSAVNNVLKAF